MTEMQSERAYPERPLVGVGAVILKDDRVLLVQRGHPPAQGTWSLPGGLVELGETAEVALEREVLEETGLHVRVGPILGLFQPIQRDSDGRVLYHFVVIDFLAYHQSGIPHVGDDAADVRWADPVDLDSYQLSPAAHDMIERAIKVVTAATG